MYNCQFCGNTTEKHRKQFKLFEYREMEYFNKKKVDKRKEIVVQSNGFEIKNETIVCEKCYKENSVE